MSKYEARINKESAGSYYALIVRVDDYEERVIHGYRGRHFASRKNAERSISNYLKKHGLA